MEKAIQIAAQLYKCRDSAKFLLGDKYAERMKEYGGAINHVAGKLKCEPLSAAQRMAEEVDDGMLQMLILAAAVEMLEPSNDGGNLRHETA